MSTNPLVAPVQDSTRWYTGLGLAEDAADITNGIQNNSWVDGSLGGVAKERQKGDSPPRLRRKPRDMRVQGKQQWRRVPSCLGSVSRLVGATGCR